MIDFKNFKKLSEDKESAVFAHPKGHKVTVVKKVLSPKMREEVSKVPLHLAEGSDQPVEDPTKLPEQPQQQQPTTVINVGTPPAQPQAAPEVPLMQRIGQHIGDSVRDGVEATGAGIGKVAAPFVTAGKGLLQGLNGTDVQAAEAPPSAPMAMPQAPAAPQMPAPQPAAPQMQDPMADIYKQMQAAPNAMIAGAQAEAKAQADLAQKNAAYYRADAQQQQQAIANFQAHYKEAENQMNDTIEDLKNEHIRPTQFMDNMSLAGKIRTGIGLILGGMGAGLTHTENPVLTMLNQNIERDVAAQVKNIETKKSVLTASFEKLKDIRSAFEMTRAMQWGLVSTNLMEEAAKSQSPIAMAKAQQATGEIRAKYINPMLQSIAQRQMLLGNNGGAGAAPMGAPGGSSGPEVDPTNIARRIQLLETTGALDKGQSDAARKEIATMVARQKALQLADENLKEQSKLQTLGSRVGSPFQSSAQLDALKAQLTPLIMDAAPSKRLTPESVHQEIEPFQIGFSNNAKTQAYKLQKLKQYIIQQSDDTPTLRGLGLVPSLKIPERKIDGK